jgi:endonuclease/exonuclease/phosphatase family metal-dependent hydrolase
MRVLTWNVAGRAGRIRAQLDAVLERAPDVIALQEISSRTYPDWRHGLMGVGYSVVSTADLVALPYPPPPYPAPIRQRQIQRKNFNLTAARHPLAALPGLRFPDPEQARLAFPEKFVAAEISFVGRLLEVHNAHAPPGSSRYTIKPHALAAVARRVDERPDLPQILCGDFNTPQPEVEGEPPETWGSRYPEVAEEWAAAELGILDHPRLRDAYKQVHVPGTPWPHSHRVKNSTPEERRYDHIYVTEHFSVLSCRHLTDWIETGLSDHAAVEADLVLDG